MEFATEVAADGLLVECDTLLVLLEVVVLLPAGVAAIGAVVLMIGGLEVVVLLIAGLEIVVLLTAGLEVVVLLIAGLEVAVLLIAGLVLTLDTMEAE